MNLFAIILLVAALVVLILAALNVQTTKLSLFALGVALYVAYQLVRHVGYT